MKFIPLSEKIFGYITQQNPAIHPALEDLRAKTARLAESQMQISHDQGALLRFLAGVINARRILEVGCFTGYSAICLASALPEDGKLITLDIDPVNTGLAEEYFQKTGLADKIELRLGDAGASLKKLLASEGASYFDLAFLDADKVGMYDYYETCLNLVRRGGLIICDNVLWSGRVASDVDLSSDTVALREFNRKIKNDARVDKTFINVADGLYLLRKL